MQTSHQAIVFVPIEADAVSWSTTSIAETVNSVTSSRPITRRRGLAAPAAGAVAPCSGDVDSVLMRGLLARRSRLREAAIAPSPLRAGSACGRNSARSQPVALRKDCTRPSW